ncbi:hypothetical protein CPB84DRAFT_1967525 [Gymnopilus junonius]|uniref:Uncharacterized protein n=1 Tax=Gymnopilus junonius TaxID=109634 RepID=A0A9P5N943_GYMJU|nr:hypothetical protein CPB84DRAFT_1967525 [Gymnopilus junonius]
MSASQFASFAAYTPPPDEHDSAVTATTSKAKSRLSSAWFPSENSYQSGGIPTFSSQYSKVSSVTYDQNIPSSQWETRYGWRVDLLAAAAYILGPVSALVILVLETQNDYVRFNAYQSALMTTPAVLLRMFISVFQSPSWLRGISTLFIVALQFLLAFRAYRGASDNNLVPYHAPLVGRIAEEWLAEE